MGVTIVLPYELEENLSHQQVNFIMAPFFLEWSYWSIQRNNGRASGGYSIPGNICVACVYLILSIMST